MASVAIKTENKTPSEPLTEFASQLVEAFGVRADETAVLSLKDGVLTFVHPADFAKVMSIPLTCSKSVAGRTALTGQSEMHNNFVNVPHLDVFENVRPIGMAKEQSRTIQKLISVAVRHHGHIVGVLQVCRKADTPFAAGPDFSARDLYRLESFAKTAALLLR